MRRRPPPPTVALPERLVRFVPSEWPGGFRDWADARYAFDDEHPGVLATDYVELARCHIAELRRVNGWSSR